MMFVRRIISWCYYNLYVRRRLARFGRKSYMKYPCKIYNGRYISVGDEVSIFENCNFMVFNLSNISPKILIGNRIRIQSNSQISCAGSVIIEDGCTFAANCFISDVTHQYEDVTIPAFNSNLKILSPVVIGEGTWVGRNVSILGAKIGKHCVIGNSCFVNKDIPDYSVVVGAPARIVKRYNSDTGIWEKTDKDGNYL